MNKGEEGREKASGECGGQQSIQWPQVAERGLAGICVLP